MFVNTFPGLISTDIPGHEVWVGQGGTALRNGRPQFGSHHWAGTPKLAELAFYSRKKTPPVPPKTSGRITGPSALQLGVPSSWENPLRTHCRGLGPLVLLRGNHFPLTESQFPHPQSVVSMN